jgi:Dyp-type peroxidase family
MAVVVLEGRTVHTAVDYTDVQGMVRYGFAQMTEAVFLLLNVRNAEAARTWLAQAPVTTALERSPVPSTALQVAFSRQGLEALEIPEHVIAGFSAEFLAGMAGDANRSRRLGDVGENAPAAWEWGAPGRIPHLVVMLFAEPGKLDAWMQSIRGAWFEQGFNQIGRLATSNLAGREHFGFIDGISQPQLDWNRTRTVTVNGNQLVYGNLVCLGEFLLGYPNEYNRYTDRPLLDAQEAASEDLPDAEDQPGKKDLGRNGSYLVVRQLRQDVRAFWQYVDEATRSTRETGFGVAEAMVGRELEDGSPLAPMSAAAIAGVGTAGSAAKREQDVRLNQFNYTADPDGMHCPFGAHIRRGNPRTADLPGDPSNVFSKLAHLLGFGLTSLHEDLAAAVRFHRILRRGREYGPGLSPGEAMQPAPPGDPERGLHFVALNANIERQFEFVQNAWMAGTKFDGLTEESDPLLGNREPVEGCPFTDGFSMPQAGKVRKRILKMPQFIAMRGGAYFFLPGIRALRYLCKEKGAGAAPIEPGRIRP